MDSGERILTALDKGSLAVGFNEHRPLFFWYVYYFGLFRLLARSARNEPVLIKVRRYGLTARFPFGRT